MKMQLALKHGQNGSPSKGVCCQGIVFEGRREGTLTPEKAEFLRSAAEGKELPLGCSFAEAVTRIRPTAIIGAAARQGVFDSDVIQALCQVRQL